MWRTLFCLSAVACTVDPDLPDDAPLGAPVETTRRAPIVEELPLGDLPTETDFIVADGVIGEPALSADGSRRVESRRSEGALSTELVASVRQGDKWVDHVLVAEGNPDRPAISADGETVAFCSAESGWASVYVVDFEGGDAQQLTNVALRPQKVEGMPVGWTPPPFDESLRFDGDWLTWNGPDAAHRIKWR